MVRGPHNCGRRVRRIATVPDMAASVEGARGAAVKKAAHALRQLYTDAVRLNFSQSDPIVSARNALGLVLPLALAAALGSPLTGVQASIGALQTAFADRPGPYRLRVIRMLGTALAAGLTAGLAAGFGDNLAASAVLVLICAFVAGELLALGPSAAQVGIAATAAALVLGHIPESPGAAVRTGLLVVAGGVVQTVLAIAAWPLRRHRPERLSLATLYIELAGLAREPIDAGTSPPLGTAIADTRAVLRGAGHDHGPSVEAYRVLLDEAVRARQDILVLSAYAERLSEEQAAAAESTVRWGLGRAAEVLDAIAALLRSGHQLDDVARGRTQQLIADVDGVTTQLGDSLTERAAANRLSTLAGQLRAMTETARTGAGEGATDEDADAPARGLRLRDPLAVIRANLDLRSPALRHATRLAVLVTLSDVVTRAAGIQRGYWIPLTILVVLRPDFASTFQRSLLRTLGTLVGLVVASVLVHYLFGDWQAAMIVLLGLFFFGMRLAGPTNMGLSSIFLAGVVVILLSIAGYPAHTTVVDRSIDTAVGGVIALGAALLWPNWERGRVPERLSDLLGSYRDYLQMMIDPNTTRAHRSAVRSDARLARSGAEASLDRARAEPVDAQAIVDLGSAVLAHSHRLVHALTAIDASRTAATVYEQVQAFRELVDRTLSTLATLQTAVRTGVSPEPVDSLRELQSQLDESGQLAAPLIEATDRLVDSLDSMTSVLREDAHAH